MSGNTLQALVFDLDGVLTDTAHYHFIAWRKLAQDLGIGFDEAFNEQLKGVDRMGSLRLILEAGRLDFPPAQLEKMADEKNQHYVRLIARMTPADLLPGALDALLRARARGLRVGLASASRNAFSVLDRLGITDLFDTVVDANDVVRGKPDPEIFLRAAQALGCPPPQCLGIEDSLAGLQAIRSAGMRSLGIGDPLVLCGADRVIAGLDQFKLDDYLD
jgi:beta-phosphoglucomutase